MEKILNKFPEFLRNNIYILYLLSFSAIIFDAFRSSSNRLALIEGSNILGFNDFLTNIKYLTIPTSILKLSFFLLPFIIVFLIEIIINFFDKSLGSRNSSFSNLKNKDKNNFSDIWYFLFHIITEPLPFIITIFSLGVSSLYASIFNFFRNIYESIIPFPTSNLSLILVFIIAILLSDFANYLKHRIDHRQIMWELHEFHHSATQMNILSNYRHTQLERISQIIPLFPIFCFTGFLMNLSLERGSYSTFIIYGLYLIFNKAFNILGHSNMIYIYPKPLSWIFMSPSLHLIHHSNNPKHFDKNFGFVFVFWDKLFGTYLDETNLKDIYGFGVEGTKYNNYHPIYAYFILPFNKFFGKIFYYLKSS